MALARGLLGAGRNIARIGSSPISYDADRVEIVLRAEVIDWLTGLGDTEQKRATRAIDRLASLGHNARMPTHEAWAMGCSN